KPPAELTVPKANEVGSHLQDEVLQTPMTPVSPVTIEALTSLQNLIKQDAHALNNTSKQRLQRHVQKLATKVRRSTRSIVLGKAKVMSYKDLEEARAKREAKE
ncbi:hypothetical protein K469DRAFT_482146, partial [Zopfia rhizophila CBS 207.26]